MVDSETAAREVLRINKSTIDALSMIGLTTMHWAVSTGVLCVVELLLKEGTDVNIKDRMGNTPLHEIATTKLCDLSIMELLLQKGADVNAKNFYGKTPLHVAVSHSETPFLEKLLTMKSVDVNAKDIDDNTPLHAAVGSNQTSTVKKLLLNKNTDVNARTRLGATPLFVAVQNEYINIVELLLNKGADVNIRDKNGNSLLHSAARAGNTSIVELLLNKNANLNAKNIMGYTLLYEAVHYGRTHVVELLLDKGADKDAHTTSGYTLLHAAARSGRAAVVEQLLNHYADIDTQTTDGYTPLHEAVRSMETSVVELLLSKGADVNKQAKNGYTPLHEVICCFQTYAADVQFNKSADDSAPTKNGNLSIAAQFEPNSIVELLLNKGADVNVQIKGGYTLLYYAVHFREVSVVELLLKKGADVKVQTENGYTLLHHAARCGALSVVKYLLNKDTDVNAQDSEGYTPLHAAARSGILPIMKVLLNKGAKVKAQTTAGHTPLHEAVRSKNASAVELLLNKGAGANVIGEIGKTPLHEAAKCGETSIVKLLVKYGAEINAEDRFRNTTLHKAVQCKESSVVELLLEYGANANAHDSGGDTPLHEAALFGETSLAKMLLNKGADVNACNRNGDTPLHNAAYSGSDSIVKLMLKKQDVNVNAPAKNKVTPLHRAVQSGNINTVLLLLSAGAEVNARQKNGNTALHEAVRHENCTIATILVRNGADVTIRNKTEDTPLSYALLFSFKYNKEIVSLLETAANKTSNHQSSKNNQSQTLFLNNCLHDIPNNSQQFNYLMSTDTSGLPGQLYETKMVSLVFLRALNHELIEHDIFLGANIDEIGALDDIFLRCRVKGRQRPIVLFMQAKHREDPKKGKLSDEALWSDSGDFRLRKYFDSYLKIRERFRAGNEDPIFEGEFGDIDCYFVLYTSAKESLTQKKTSNNMNEIIHDLINTKENMKPFQYNYNKSDLSRLNEVAAIAGIEKLESNSALNMNKEKNYNNLAIDFFSRLWFYPSQAKEDEVEIIIKEEINKHYNNKKDQNNFKFELHSNAIFLKVHHEIQEWWKLKSKAPYLKRSNDPFKRAKLACLADVLLIVCNAMNYFKVSVNLEFNHNIKQRSSDGTLGIFNSNLCRLFSLINTENMLITIDMEFKNYIVNLLLADAETDLPSSDRSQNAFSFPKRNTQDMISYNNLPNDERFEYSKKAGTSEVGGTLFRMKMLCLVLLRVLNHGQIKQNPQLGTRIRGISFLNDICLRYNVEAQERPVVLFVQLIHRHDPQKGQLTVEELWNDSGNFSLKKCFASYLEIKDRFWADNKDPMFKGEFCDVDCHFLIYTSAKASFTKKKTGRQVTDIVHTLLSTRQNTESFRLDYDEDDIDCLIKVTEIEKLGTVFLKNTERLKYYPDILSDKLISRYHVAMRHKVLQQCEVQPPNKEYRLWKFRSEFFNSDLDYLVTLKKSFVKLTSKCCEQSKITNACQQSDEDCAKLKSLEMRLPLAFGNLDMTIRGNETKVRKRIQVLADKLKCLLELNKDTKIIEINEDDVGPGKTIEQGIINMNGGFGSAVGNLLVLDSDNNMLKFDLENEALPHNAALLLKELQDDIYKPFNEDLGMYRIKININGFPKDSFNVDDFDRRVARDFLSKLWFCPDQAKEDEVECILQSEINQKYTRNKIPHNHNDKHINIFDSISLYSLDDIRKWWLQTSESPYISKASELFERAELADMYNLLQTVINYMYISDIYSMDIKVKQVNEDEKYEQMQQVFKKISSKLLNLFDPQFNEPVDYNYGSSNSKIGDTFKLSLRIHPTMEWVALMLVVGSESHVKYRIFAKAGAVHKASNSKNRQAKEEFMIYEQTFSGSACKLFRDCLRDIFL